MKDRPRQVNTVEVVLAQRGQKVEKIVAPPPASKKKSAHHAIDFAMCGG